MWIVLFLFILLLDSIMALTFAGIAAYGYKGPWYGQMGNADAIHEGAMVFRAVNTRPCCFLLSLLLLP